MIFFGVGFEEVFNCDLISVFVNNNNIRYNHVHNMLGSAVCLLTRSLFQNEVKYYLYNLTISCKFQYFKLEPQEPDTQAG